MEIPCVGMPQNWQSAAVSPGPMFSRNPAKARERGRGAGDRGRGEEGDDLGDRERGLGDGKGVRDRGREEEGDREIERQGGLGKGKGKEKGKEKGTGKGRGSYVYLLATVVAPNEWHFPSFI